MNNRNSLLTSGGWEPEMGVLGGQVLSRTLFLTGRWHLLTEAFRGGKTLAQLRFLLIRALTSFVSAAPS